MELEPIKIGETPQIVTDAKVRNQAKRDEMDAYRAETGRNFIPAKAAEWMAEAVASGDAMEISNVVDRVCTYLVALEKPVLQQMYIDELGKIRKPAKMWKDAFSHYVASELKYDEEIKPESDIDEDTLVNFGFFEKDNCYYFSKNGAKYEAGTNFVIEPLFHIKGGENKRLIRIVNMYSRSEIIEVPSKAMVSPDLLQQVVYETGNFLVFVQKQQFMKIISFIGEKFIECNELKTFGWQGEGFFAFANGIYNGEYKPVDEMGIVEHKKTKYYLAAYSSVNQKNRADDDEFENDRFFKYRPSSVDFDEWSCKFQQVYGINGTYGVAFLLASLFRSEIYKLYKFFPHLFLFGEKASGKSQMGWSLSNVFLDGQPPFNLSSGTDVAFFRKLGRYRDVIVWYDEFTNAIDEKRFQALKSAFDGVGREKGKMSRDSRTEQDRIVASSCISGQYLPTRDDNALYTRSIVLTFNKRDFTQNDITNFDALKHMEANGLSNIVTEVLKHRAVFVANYNDVFDRVFSDFRRRIKQRGEEAEDRIMRNYCILASTVRTMFEHIDININIDIEEFEAMCINDIVNQSEKIIKTDALATFWSIFSNLIDQARLVAGKDFMIEARGEITVRKKENGEVNFETKTFAEEKTLLFFNLDNLHPHYLVRHREMFGEPGLGKQTLMDYVHNHRAFIGSVASHRFAKIRTSAYVFDYAILEQRGIVLRRGDFEQSDKPF